jgi:hypothetical protein
MREKNIFRFSFMREKIIFILCSFLLFVNNSFAQEKIQFFSDKKIYKI